MCGNGGSANRISRKATGGQVNPELSSRSPTPQLAQRLIFATIGELDMDSLLIPVLMCGGAGTRLWPVSRECMPKQFVPLLGQSSTFSHMLQLISAPDLFARPIVITNQEFRFVVAEQLREKSVEADVV